MPHSRLVAFFCLFFVSGACGLIYEIVWSRLLVFVFGGTTFAVTTVLACFMGGLALGSYLAGRLSHNVSKPARFYGFLEIGIGLYCLFIPFLFDLALPAYRALATASGGSFSWLTAGRVLVCTAILIIPTAFMGATLPILSKAFVRRSQELGGTVARLYGINTMGAFVGCAGAGLFLLPAAGLSNSIALAASLNIAAGVVALVISREPRKPERPEPLRRTKRRQPVRKIGGDVSATIRPGVLLLLYGLSGFAAMAYQVAWTRALILALGASTYAFSAIAACFILGIALGSLLISRWVGRARSPLALAALLEGMIGLSALLVVPLFGEMPGLVSRLTQSAGATFGQLLATEVLCVFALLVVPTFCMGALLPLVCVVYEALCANHARSGSPAPDGSPGPATGRTVGAVYASNTVGNILGAAVAGFVLIPSPAMGMQRTILSASALSGLIATAFILSARPRRRRPVYAATPALWLVGIALAVIAPRWSQAVMVSGPFLGARAGQSDSEEVLFYREGIDTTVAVIADAAGTRTLLVNGKPDASSAPSDMRTQLLLGHIPLLLKPHATDVCVIGLGAGVTASAALAHPVERVDALEISSAVVAAAEYFSDYSNNIFTDARLTLRRADARNFLLMSDRQYDVVISEPSNPWMSGIANLFTTEFFEIVERRLKPGGLHCQWFHGYSMEADDFAAIIKTMSTVFQYTQLWEMNYDDYLMLCSNEPIVIDVESMYFTFQRPAVKAMLSFLFVNSPIQMAHYYIADGRHLASWTDRQQPLTDDSPRLEFSAPRYLLRDESGRITRDLHQADGTPRLAGDAESLLNRQFLEDLRDQRKAKELLMLSANATNFQENLEYCLQLARYARHDARLIKHIDSQLAALYNLAPAYARPTIDAYYEKIVGVAPAIRSTREAKTADRSELLWPLGELTPASDPELEVMMAEVNTLLEQREFEKAAEKAEQTARLFRYDPRAQRLAGTATLQLRGPYAAIPYLLQAWNMRPADPETSYHLARAYCLRGEPDRAVTFLQTAIANGFDDPIRIESGDVFECLRNDPRFQQLLGQMRGDGE